MSGKKSMPMGSLGTLCPSITMASRRLSTGGLMAVPLMGVGAGPAHSEDGPFDAREEFNNYKEGQTSTQRL